MGFPRQEYWSGLPFPSPGDLPNPGIKPGSPALEADALTSEPPGKPKDRLNVFKTRENQSLTYAYYKDDASKYDIEHTVPRSRGGDNSQMNKTLCESRFNRDVKKGSLLNYRYLLSR